MGKRIRLSESMLRSIIRESVIKALNEEEEKKSKIRILMDKMHNTNDVRKVLQYAKEIEKLIQSGEVPGFSYETDGSTERKVMGVVKDQPNGFAAQLDKRFGG